MKSGQVMDVTFVVVLIVLVCASTIISFVIFKGLDSALKENNMNSTVYESTATNMEKMFTFFDAMIPLALILSLLSIVISSFFIDTHPAFFIVSVFVSVFVIILTAVFGNFFQHFINATETMASTSTNFPMMSWLSENLMIFASVGVVIVLVALYAKWKGGATF